MRNAPERVAVAPAPSVRRTAARGPARAGATAWSARSRPARPARAARSPRPRQPRPPQGVPGAAVRTGAPPAPPRVTQRRRGTPLQLLEQGLVRALPPAARQSSISTASSAAVVGAAACTRAAATACSLGDDLAVRPGAPLGAARRRRPRPLTARSSSATASRTAPRFRAPTPRPRPPRVAPGVVMRHGVRSVPGRRPGRGRDRVQRRQPRRHRRVHRHASAPQRRAGARDHVARDVPLLIPWGRPVDSAPSAPAAAAARAQSDVAICSVAAPINNRPPRASGAADSAASPFIWCWRSPRTAAPAPCGRRHAPARRDRRACAP